MSCGHKAIPLGHGPVLGLAPWHCHVRHALRNTRVASPSSGLPVCGWQLLRSLAAPNELKRVRSDGLIGCGIRPCLPATIPVFQLFDAPRADGTHPLTRSFASPKELIDESDVLPPLWGVFPLTAARGLPQELHTLLGLCLRVAKAKSGMLREPCGALWGVVLLGPQLGQHGRPAVADDGVFSLPSRCAGAQKTSTSPTYHSVFQRSAPEQPLAVRVAFSFCGLRMMLRRSV